MVAATTNTHTRRLRFTNAYSRRMSPTRDAAEALIVYAWMHSSMTMEEGLEILEQNENSLEAFSCLLLTAKMKLEKTKRI